MDAAEMKRTIADTLANRKTLSQKEVDDVWFKVTGFIETLPESERGAFYWNSCAEALFMMTTESKRGSP